MARTGLVVRVLSLLESQKKTLLVTALKICKYNRTHTASYLGISVRTVRSWIKKYNLEPELKKDQALETRSK